MRTDANTSTSGAYSLAPMLSVRNGARAVGFYKSAFGAVEVFKIESPDGAVVARLAIEGADRFVGVVAVVRTGRGDEVDVCVDQAGEGGQAGCVDLGPQRL